MKSLRLLPTGLWFLLVALLLCWPAMAQQKTPTPKPAALTQEVSKLQSQVKVLKDRIAVLSARSQSHLPAKEDVSTGGVAILFGAFCALWAQNTRKNALLWFLFGLFFNVIAVFVLLYKNSVMKRKSSGQRANRG